jgi:coniferyl-aldehyde dehydrogenase
LPFGGIGPAGMGAYHGHDGFREFSHRKSIFHQMKRDIAPLRMLRPPYGAGIARFLATQIKRSSESRDRRAVGEARPETGIAEGES